MEPVVVVYFKNAAGEVHPVRLPALEAAHATRAHPHEWSLDGKTFAPPPAGYVPATGNGGGIGRLLGATASAD